MSGPPRPRCRRHEKNDCDLCRGMSKKVFGEEFHDGYFGPDEYRYADGPIRAAGRSNETPDG